MSDSDIAGSVRLLLIAWAMGLLAKLLSDLIAERGRVWPLWKTFLATLVGLVLLLAALPLLGAAIVVVADA